MTSTPMPFSRTEPSANPAARPAPLDSGRAPRTRRTPPATVVPYAGIPGHYSTKSRCYSTTLRALRNAREEWRNRRLLAGLGCEETARVWRGNVHRDGCEPNDPETILVLGQWQYVRRGHSPGEARYPATIAHDLAENRRICPPGTS
jgi:hypothetical protein